MFAYDKIDHGIFDDMNKSEDSNKINVYALYAYHYRCELLAFVLPYIIKYMSSAYISLLLTFTKRVCQLCRDNIVLRFDTSFS